ncbi:MAG: DUF4214 domain-containing protein [Clostridia bacterium]|nr:DUF4214 domain-containing protein [Clostridia bacterium]
MNKRVVITLLSLVMSVSLVSMMPFASNVCEAWDGSGHVNINHAITFINDVTVTGVNQPIVGQTVADMKDSVKVPDGAHYKVKKIDWYVVNGTSINKIDDSHVFNSTNKYAYNIYLEPKTSSYLFPHGTTGAYTGSVSVSDYKYKKCTLEDGCLVIAFSDVTAKSNEITEVAITGVKGPVVGKTVAEINESVKVPDDAPYTIYSIYWMAVDGYNAWEMSDDEVFESSFEYYYKIGLKPKDPYFFPKTTIEDNDTNYTGTCTINGSDDLKLYCRVKQSQLLWINNTNSQATTEINEVTITGINQPVIGKTAAEMSETITVPEDAPYTIQSVYWGSDTIRGTASITNRMFENPFIETTDDMKYRCTILLKPKDGYSFPHDFSSAEWPVYTGTVSAGDYGTVNKHIYLFEKNESYECLNLNITNLSSVYEIDDVAVTGMPTPKANTNCDVSGISISSTTEDACTVDSMFWWDEANDCEAKTFEEGKSYHLCIKLSAKDGCGFRFDAEEDFVGTATINEEAATAVKGFDGTGTYLLLTSKSVIAPGLMRYNVHFERNGHGTVPTDQLVIENTQISKPDAPSALGFIFEGWYSDKDCTKEFDFNSAINSDVTVYAKWKQCEHKHTEIRDAKAASVTEEGYTGDTCCKDCGAVISSGKSIPKLTSTPTPSSNPTPTATPTATPTSNPTTTPGGNTSGGTTPTPAPELDVGAFINRCYEVALGREADEEGYYYWVNNLNTGLACGAQVGYGFIFSNEYLNKATTNEQFVNDMYAMYFGREADEEGFKYWKDQLDNGTDRENVMAGFANSLEFFNLCEKYGVVCGTYLVGVPNTQQGGVNCFVARLYKVCLNRLPDMGGQAGWVLKLNKGEVSGTTCAYGFVFSAEFIELNLDNTDYVKYMYKAFFGRDADDAGLNYWVSQLNGCTASREDVFAGFSGSPEFINLCASYGINA